MLTQSAYSEHQVHHGRNVFYTGKKHMADSHCCCADGIANIVLKLRITVLAGDKSASWLAYLLSLMFDPWTWSALIAAVVTGTLYVISLRQLEISVVQPLFALVFVVVPLAAMFFLGEHLPPLRILGLVLIFIGVILVGQTA